MARIGVLALQGAFAAHVEKLVALGADVVEVRRAEHLIGLEGLVLPGGESTTMSNLLVSSGLEHPLRAAIDSGLAVFGTCAGMILLSAHILDGRDDQISFAAIDATVRRNAYGRQVDSFECDLDVASLDGPFHAIFIRAPAIERLGSGVEVLASWNGRPVLIRSARVMAASFHPELTSDSRVHRLFLDLVESQLAVR
ncbi:MAG: pyridoxal 5'-phosphate synthase glutaminase subunit PdxT [Acidimicrobiales bacterium mtb01]|nr:pyridoxal 5'-phosphate synthase glutaminase subunit PdxT [Actinomycetota bacterium]TEX45208.1 MAG: pyridoxal 5'-phosphate synthase glutaminase subunit PdxT [Acidimicrobiales bacterium mtb01]